MKYIVNPHIIITNKRNATKIVLPYERTEVEASWKIRNYLEYFKKPGTKAGFLSAHNVSQDVFDFLLEHALIFPTGLVQVMSKGVCVAAGTSGFDEVKLTSLAKRAYKQALLGIPIDFTQNKRYTPKGGPGKIREAIFSRIRTGFGSGEYLHDLDFGRMIKLKSMHTCDLGDIAYYPNYDSEQDIHERVKLAMKALFDNGLFPIVLGGDHAISYFTIQSLSKLVNNLGVIQIDAHSDLNSSPDSPNHQLSHANVFYKLSALEEVSEIVQMGVRTLSHMPDGLEPQPDKKIKRISSYQLMRDDYRSRLSVLHKSKPYYLSVDLDVLDPSLVHTEVDTPVVGGLNYYRLAELISHLVANYTIIAVDFVEVAAGEKGYNYAAHVASRLALNIIMEKSGAIPIPGYRQ